MYFSDLTQDKVGKKYTFGITHFGHGLIGLIMKIDPDSIVIKFDIIPDAVIFTQHHLADMYFE